ncbi:MAG: S8 family serine peptidase [Eubacterium sp.]|nr:S8 family serine peptidase [Eubacterium sp.]
MMIRDLIRKAAVLAVSAVMMFTMTPAAVFGEAGGQAGNAEAPVTSGGQARNAEAPAASVDQVRNAEAPAASMDQAGNAEAPVTSGDQAGCGEQIVLEDGTFVPGEVVVLFKAGSVKDKKMSLDAAMDLENVDKGFGCTMEAANEENEAAEDAKSEVKILKESLGDDFEILDSIAFSDDLIMSLVRSDKYETEVLIEKLSDNKNIESAEPNWYTEEKSTYSLDDMLAKYAYHTNSPKDSNESGDDASTRGADLEETISTRAGSVTDFKDGKSGDEIVVAVNDSGINYNHEDLKNMLWTNPGDIGLDGEHGFNFDDNMTDVMDTLGHGTHVSGIIAAEANNGKGVAGVASGVNVKIMMCATNTAQEEPPDITSLYRRSGAMYYALKAKQRGVNVVAINNSWGSPGPSYSYNKILNTLGEAGIMNFVAASNDALDIDKINYCPPGGSSPYTVVVGSSNIDGVPSGFSDYGKSNVDLFAPGHSILSTVCYSSYFPNLYTEAERAENTEYYGQFSSETSVGSEVVPELGMKEVVPDTHGEGVKQFGAAKFFVQDSNFDPDDEGEQDPDDDGEQDPDGDGEQNPDGDGEQNPDGDGEQNPDDDGEQDPDDEEEQPDLPEATCDVSVVENRFFTDNYGAGSSAKPASLKVTVNNAKVGESYFVYFPYAKNHETTGYDNTRYSVTMIKQSKEDEFSANVYGCEIVKHDKNGTVYCEAVDGDFSESDPGSDAEVVHMTGLSSHGDNHCILSWDEVDPEKTDIVETGIGVSFTVFKGKDIKTPEEEEFIKGAHPVTLYFDSIAVSEPVTEEGKTPEDVFPADSSYDLMSGTSMATPAATGAYAVLCALEPKEESQTEKEYVLGQRARFFSLVTRRDELKDLCSTGGYIDLSKIKEESVKSSITEAVCDVDKGTLTLHGTGFSDDLMLYKKSLAEGLTEVGVHIREDDRISIRGDASGAGIDVRAEDASGAGIDVRAEDASGDGIDIREEAREILIDKDRISVAADGKSLTISDAWDLFGTYTRFILKDAGGVRANGSFFIVRGQKEPELVLSEEHKETVDDSTLPPKYLFTDKDGKDLYAYQLCSYDLFADTAGELFKYDGNKFIEYQGTKLGDAMFDYFENNLGYNRHEITRGLEVTPKVVRQPITDGKTLYTFVDTSYSPRDDAEEEDIETNSYLAAMDFTADKPAWQFKKISPLADSLEEYSEVREDKIAFCMLKDKIYAFGAAVEAGEGDDERSFTFAFAFDPKTGEWNRLDDLPDASLSSASAFVKDDKIYLMFGSDADTVVNKNVYTFDGKAWVKDGTIPFIGRLATDDSPNDPAAAPVKDGIIIFNYSAQGAGNVYLYNTASHRCEPLYYTIDGGLSDALYTESSESAVETRDGLYFIRLMEDDAVIKRFDLYRIPKSSKAYRPTYKDPNPMTVKASGKTVKASKLKKKSVTVKAVTVKKAEGKVTFKRVKIKCPKKLAKAAKAKISVNRKTGKITLKKGLKKGKYIVSVRVTAAGNDYYDKVARTVKVKITVK